ncbi:PREDICTED: uncharacterized protein LOC109166976 [Ipomoea nil]|uniref:uncharacterized protein LOC109166976 n=1 Tax=Ipomoea nil TaxID=35883 RepID=UPI0009008E86|nr:PREDICTED: uncharacterized protein LOC109166976 [Ipomoea nil]
MNRVLDDGPWSFENNLLVCAQVQPGVRPEEVDLTKVPVWIQIHGLPTIFASTEFITRIGDYVGTFAATDPHNFGGGWRSYYRMRVLLNVNVPLKRRMKIIRKDGSTLWITFRYERLNIFCFCCGILGHIDKHCKKAYEEGVEPDEYPFGAWMKAGPRRQVKPIGAKWLLPSRAKTMVAVPGEVSPSVALAVVEENGGLHGDLKRRREGSEEVDDVTGKDVVMEEHSKNFDIAGLANQSCPTQ